MALAEYFREITGAPLTPHIDRDHHRAMATVIDSIGSERFAAVRAAVRDEEPDQEVAAALAWMRQRGSPAPPVPAGDGLTQRERDVLRLIAAGKSNQDIANALFLSPGTVKVHVTHILGKLDVKSRSAATDYAHRHGLA